MVNVVKDNIEAVIANLETQLKNNESINIDDLRNLVANFEFLAKINANRNENKKFYSDEDLDKLRERINTLTSTCDITYNLKSNSDLKNKVISMPNNGKNNIAKLKKNLTNRVALWTTIVGLGISAAVGGIACNTAPKTETTVSTNVSNTSETKDENNRSIDEITTDITKIVNDMFEKGMHQKVTEETKEAFCKNVILNYYALRINDNNVNVKELASVFVNETFISDDFRNSIHNLNRFDRYRVVAGDTYLDYSLQYSKKIDAELLKEASEKFDKIKKTKGNERETAVAEFKQLILDKLGNPNNRMNYSEMALNTFRAVYYTAFDEITKHAVIDDELEHIIRTTAACSMDNTELNVESQKLQSLQSNFELYLAEKFEKRLDEAKEYAKENPDKLDSEKTYAEILKRVCAAIDLSKQKENPNYTETLRQAGGVYAPAQIHPNDSGINVPGVGNIAKSDVERARKLGVTSNDPDDIKKALDEAAKEEYFEEVNGNKTTEDNAEEMSAQGYANGYEDGCTNSSKNYGSSSSAYKSAYDSGYIAGQRDYQEINKETKKETKFESVDEKVVDKKETENVENYTGEPKQASLKSEPEAITPSKFEPENLNSTFVPIEPNSGEEIIEETEEQIQDYVIPLHKATATSYSTSEQIQLLKGLKEMINEEISEEASKTK